MDHYPQMSFQSLMNQIPFTFDIFSSQMFGFLPSPNIFGTALFTPPPKFRMSSLSAHHTIIQTRPRRQKRIPLRHTKQDPGSKE